MNSSKVRILISLFLLFIIPIIGGSQIELPPLFTDYMVIQRHRPIHIWGKATTNSVITVKFNKCETKTTTNSDGIWAITFPSMDAGGPYQLNISSENEIIILNDILIGEVWVCSGQSNMQFSLKNSAESEDEIPKIENPNIRLFRMHRRHNLGPVTFSEADMEWLEKGEFMSIDPWKYCGPESAPDFSAVAYQFGKVLFDSLNVPIGLIQNAIGGSTIESWIDLDAINKDQNLAYLSSRNWYDHRDVHPWVSSRVKKNLEPWIDSGDSERSFAHPFAPGYLFNCGIKPLIPFSIRGVIWYQGESNATSSDTYHKLFELMVDNWRTSLQQYGTPFLFVQLPRIANRSRWPEFREQQEMCLDIPNTGMVVTIDEGHKSNVHPKEKKIVGKRLADLALNMTYGFTVNAKSPTKSSYEWIHGERQIKINFVNAGDGLLIKDADVVKGFTINGFITDGGMEQILKPKNIEISSNAIVLTYPERFIPVTVKYAWAPYPENNVVSSSGLPLAPFKIELNGNN